MSNMIVVHLISIVILARPAFTLHFDDSIIENSRSRKSQDIDHTIYFFEEASNDDCPDGYYRQKQQKICRHLCEKACSYGKCTGPEQCSCNKGYELDPDDSYTCLPICGVGMQRNLQDKQKCEPAMCSKECINSLCRGREDCHCMVGFQKDPSNSYACTPKCTEASCKNGTCMADGECTCNEGYFKEMEHCAPWCNRTCMNATCTEPNVCTCLPGYRNISEHQCECPEQNFIVDGICKRFDICNVNCEERRCTIQETCYYCPEPYANCVLIDMSQARGKCLNSTLCLTNCQCSNEVCTCEHTSAAATTTTPFGHTYSPSLPEVRTYDDFNEPEADVQNNPSSTIVISAGVALVLLMGAAVAAGMVIRKRRRKSGGRFVQNDIYRAENSPEVHAIEVENEIYEEQNAYEEIGEKNMKSEQS